MTPNCERWCSESFLVKEVDKKDQLLLIPAEPIHKLVEAASGEESCVGR
jgi:hypothetical protein